MTHWQWDPGRVGVEHHIGAAGIVGMVLMCIVWAAVMVAIVLGIRALIIHSRRGTHLAAAAAGTAGTSDGTPAITPERSNLLEILEGRYAKGEITREEFLERKQDLNLS